MKRALQILAVVLAVATISLWVAKGANTGFTKNRIQVKVIDPGNRNSGTSQMAGSFIPGIEYLGGGLIAAGAFFVGSFFIRKQTKQQNPHTS
jgi:hypothetical protein